MHGAIAAVLRPGASGKGEIVRDCAWLVGFALVLIATGLGLRDPWPADEPRFALIARDMVASGDWLVPRVGGELYAQKPPLYFWLMALALELTGSLRIAFLLPSVLAGIGTVLLTYDLARRLWNREVGIVAGLLLLVTVQFVWQARQAQIDATLCFLTTLSLYGLLRHLLRGPSWRWYLIGCAAAGFGVITKGVGFLPLLILIPYALLRAERWHPRSAAGPAWYWLGGALAFAAAVSVWLVPMLIATQTDPALAEYRHAILFEQTVTRYADAWHHREPFWYFIVEVLPWAWLPITVLLPWMLPGWRAAWREGDLRVILPLAWVLLVVLFFSLSAGKRGVYVLPAVPALVLASAPLVMALAARRAVQRAVFALACTIGAACAAAAIVLIVRPSESSRLSDLHGLDPLGPLVLMSVLVAVICVLLRPARGWAAYGAVCIVALLTVSFWINPALNAERSGAAFAARIERSVEPGAELGLAAYKEQHLLQLARPSVNFGHRRWLDSAGEAADAAHWLNAGAGRVLLVNERVRVRCFSNAATQPLGLANREQWYLVKAPADAECAARGSPNAALTYVPPDTTQRADERAAVSPST